MSCKFCNGEATMEAENEFWIEMNGSAMCMSHVTRYAEFASVVEINFCPMCGEALAEPEPLTLEELKGMDGEPIYITELKVNKSYWMILNTQKYEVESFKLYGNIWLAYRRPPKEGK